jgi:hypothetical protein
MEGVFSAGQFSVREVAIAINEPRNGQRHIGLLYEDPSAEALVILHLAFHLDLKQEPPPLEGLWVDPTFLTERLRQVASIARQVWNRNAARIPFGFSRPNDCFDGNTYEYLIGPTQHGLTCATFVLAIFLAAGLEIVRYESWPTRSEDDEWQRSILRPLAGRANEAHITAVEEDLGAIRVRPEEVAAAASLTPLPADFERTEPASLELLRLLRLE